MIKKLNFNGYPILFMFYKIKHVLNTRLRIKNKYIVKPYGFVNKKKALVNN